MESIEEERNRLAQRILVKEDLNLAHQLNQFCCEMGYVLGRQLATGNKGWDALDNDDWTIEEIKRRLLKHVEKGDPIDVANYALFWWSMEKAQNGETKDLDRETAGRSVRLLSSPFQ